VLYSTHTSFRTHRAVCKSQICTKLLDVAVWCSSLQAPDVRAAFKDVARTFGGRSDAAAESWMGGLLESNRYLEDVWAG
jgi:hypothetical protein